MELRQTPKIMENYEGENKNISSKFDFREFIHFIYFCYFVEQHTYII